MTEPVDPRLVVGARVWIEKRYEDGEREAVILAGPLEPVVRPDHPHRPFFAVEYVDKIVGENAFGVFTHEALRVPE